MRREDRPTFSRRSSLLSAAALLFLLPQATLGAQDEDEPEKDPPVTHEESVEVTAGVGPSAIGPIGAASSVLDPALTDLTLSSLTSLATSVPGVSESGQGGILQGFSIRGVAKQRLRHMISGVRITSDRRAGPSTSFVDPLLMGTVEILRGPSATLHGSGAMGGVVQTFPRQFRGWNVQSGFDSDGNESFLVAGVGGEGWSAGIARREADRGEAADGSTLNTGFTQHSAVIRGNWQRGDRSYEILAVPTIAQDIGKSNTDFPDRTTTYPLERHQLLKFGIDSARGWHLHSFVHAHDLETEVVAIGAETTRVFSDTVDTGVRWVLERDVGRASARFGVEGFGRLGVDTEEITEGAKVTAALSNARELETGAFATLRRDWKGAVWQTGARLSWQGQENGDGTDLDRVAWNGFVAGSGKLGERWEVSGILNTGLRFPSLTELFFTGTTGRGLVSGNPALKSERAVGGEVSLRWRGAKLRFGGTLFHTRIDDYIERIETAPDVLTFDNLISGKISGLELEGSYTATGSCVVGWGGHVMDGSASGGGSLADIPPDELYVDTGCTSGDWSYRVHLGFRNDKTDPGSGEKIISSAELLTTAVRYRVTPEWTVSLRGANLLDELYFSSADRKAPLAPGRSAAIHLIWNGE